MARSDFQPKAPRRKRAAKVQVGEARGGRGVGTRAFTHSGPGAKKSLAQPRHRFVTGVLARLEGFEPPTNGFGSQKMPAAAMDCKARASLRISDSGPAGGSRSAALTSIDVESASVLMFSRARPQE